MSQPVIKSHQLDAGTGANQVVVLDGSGALPAVDGSNLTNVGSLAGPGSSTDNAIMRWDGAGGDSTQNSLVILSDTGAMSGITQLNVDNLQLDTNSLNITQTNGSLTLNANGTGNVIINSGTTGETHLYEGGELRLQVDAQGADLRHNTNPTLGFETLAGSVLGFIEAHTTNGVEIQSQVHGAPVTISAETAGGSLVDGFVFDPDTGVDFPTGTISITNNLTVDGQINFATDGQLSQFASNVSLSNQANSGIILLTARDSSGNLDNLFAGNPNGQATLYFAGSDTARTAATGSGGFEVNNQSTGAGFERVLTESDLPASNQFILAQKTANTSRASTTTLADDPHLSATLTAFTTYLVEMVLHFDTPSAAGFKFRFRIISGNLAASPSNYRFTYVESDNGGTQGFTSSSGSLTDSASDWITVVNVIDGMIANNRPVVLHLTGFITANNADTELVLEWAQNSSHATNTTLRVGSFIKYTPVS